MYENYCKILLIISTMSSTFESNKNELSALLKNVACHVLFPTSLIEDIKQYGSIFGAISDMESFNKQIVKARELIIELNKLTEWGLFLNSTFAWKMTVARVCLDFVIARDNIIIESATKNYLKKMVFAQNNINASALLIFTNLKINELGQLIVVNPHNTSAEQHIDPKVVHKLLPSFIQKFQSYHLDSSELELISSAE